MSFDFTTVAENGNVEPLTRLTTLSEWLFGLLLTILGRFAIVVLSKVLVALYATLPCKLCSVEVGTCVIGLVQINSLFSFSKMGENLMKTVLRGSSLK